MEKLLELDIYNQLLSALGRDRTCPQRLQALQVGRALRRIAHDSSCRGVMKQRFKQETKTPSSAFLWLNISIERRNTEV